MSLGSLYREIIMKAIVHTKYGPPHVLQLKEVAKPVPGEYEVLVKIYATAVNDYDWSLVRGKPYPYRLMYGMLKPKNQIPGMELSGVVEAIGAKVTAFRPGDAVYGDISEYGFGSFAEYICVNEKALVLKPDKMTFEEAAAIPHAVLLAVQGLIDIGKIKQGQKILINGAGGGVGTFGLQLSRLYGAEVTGVDTGEKLKMMKEMGFDHIIDYKKEDFTSVAAKKGQLYDLILDAKTSHSPFAYARALKPHGKYVTVGGYLPRLLQLLLLKGWVSRVRQKGMHIVALKPNKDLAFVNQLFEEGKIKPFIDGPYTLEDVPRVLQYFGDGKHQGKVVISVAQPHIT